MDIQNKAQFNIIGIATRTTNENQQSAKDIPALWEQFISEGVAARIPDKIDNAIYCVYTDYEKDHTKPYTTLLGCAVFSLEGIPEGLLGRTFEGANYIKFVAKGDLAQGVVVDEWIKIWNADLPRAFTTDFEVYGEQAQDPAHAAVDIFIAVK